MFIFLFGKTDRVHLFVFQSSESPVPYMFLQEVLHVHYIKASFPINFTAM